MYEATVIADSLSPDGVRLTTFQVTYPHAIHKDIMTHRMLSRNFQSFRAYPPEKVIEIIQRDPFIPEAFAKRVKGMEQGEAVGSEMQAYLLGRWKAHIQNTIDLAKYMLTQDIAKQQINFLLQDFTWITGIITATEWDNFWALRADPTEVGSLPRPEVQKIAKMMKQAYLESDPGTPIEYSQWHLPLMRPEDFQAYEIAPDAPWYEGDWETLAKISAGRCARVSYLTHDGERDPEADIALADRLMSNGHMSPFEHQARPAESRDCNTQPYLPDIEFFGNFRGWVQYRKGIPHESNYGAMMEAVAA